MKRIYAWRTFLRDVLSVTWHLPDLIDAARSRRVSRAFAEKIMLAVTRVNDCRYCCYFHSHRALRSGVSEDELRRLLEWDLGTFPEKEVVALAFAQHYAESGGRPDVEALRRLDAYYGPRVSRDILSYIRVITIGNLTGNTLDAILRRLRLLPAPHR